MKKNVFIVMLILFFSFIHIGDVKAGGCDYKDPDALGSSVTIYYNGGDLDFEMLQQQFSGVTPIKVDASLFANGNCPTTGVYLGCEANSSAGYDCKITTDADTATKYKLPEAGTDVITEDDIMDEGYDAMRGESDSSSEYTPEKSETFDATDSDTINSATSDAFSICDSTKNPGVMAVFKLGSWLILIIKIVIPIILIIFGMIDMAKAVVDSNDDAIKKNAIAFGRRVAIAVIIFFVPTLLLNIFTFIDGWNDVKSNYADCIDCLFDLSKCPENATLINTSSGS